MCQKGRPWHKYKDRILEANQLFAFSEMFGWTPEQIRSLSEEDKDIYLAWMTGRSRAKNK